jgi:hypothetical protein
VAAEQAHSDAAPFRRIEVSPQRLPGWIRSFAERHGALTAESNRTAVTFLATDGASAVCQVPFPPLTPPLSATPPPPQTAASSQTPARSLADQQADGSTPDRLAERIAAHAQADRTVGVLLVRLGGYAAGVFTGTDPTLAASKVGSRLVHGRSAAGGTSQRRFARRRENQAHQALAAAADTAAAVFGPYRLDAVVLGGDRRAIAGIMDDPRLAPYRALAVEAFLTVPDPRLAVLKSTPPQFRAIRIKLTEPTPAVEASP